MGGIGGHAAPILKVSRTIRLAVIAAAIAFSAFAFREPLGRAFAGAAASALTGDRVSFGSLALSSTRIAATRVSVARGSDPLFDADRIAIAYDARAFLFGGARRYGLSRVELDRPRLTFVRHADGSFDLGGGSGATRAAASSSTANVAPLRFALIVRGGSARLVDPNRTLPVSRDLRVDGIDAVAAIDSAGRTSYRASARLAGDASQPLTAAGRVDADGFATHRLRAANVDLPPIVDYFINAPSAELLRGRARDVDVRLYALPHGGDAAYHLSGIAHVEDGAMHVPGLAVDATRMTGTIDAFDDGLASPGLDARLGTLDVRLAGGLFHWHAPSFRLGIVSRANLADARAILRFSRRLPLRGDARLSTLLEGPVGDPLVATSVDAPELSYARYPVTAAGGRAIYFENGVDVVGARGSYGGLAVSAGGSIALGEAVRTRLVVDAAGPAARVPYAAEIAPAATLRTTGLLSGIGLAFDARGVTIGSGGGTNLTAPFHVDPRGDGAFGPIVARRDDGASVAGTFYLDRAHSSSGFWLDARDYPFSGVGRSPRLPGVGIVAPSFSGRLSGAVAGFGPPSAFRLAGRVRARDLHVGSVTVDDVTGDLAGAFGNVRLGRVAARGPWGRFTGRGAYAGDRLALAGDYAGSFERLRTFTGNLGGAGALAGPVTLLIDPRRTLVQTTGVAAAANVHGVPVERIEGTLAVAGGGLRVFAATAAVAGGGLAAAGNPEGLAGLGVSLAHADASRVRSGVPLERGLVSAIGSVRGGALGARFDGGLSVDGASVDRIDVAGNGDLSFVSGRVSFGRTDALVGGVAGSLEGRVSRLGSPAADYDVRLHLPSASLAPLARAFALQRDAIAGTLEGDVRVSGRLADPRLDGELAIPEGTVNGLAFSDAAARVSIDPGGIRLRHGRVIVGSTVTSFGALYHGDDAAIRVRATNADLSDFNGLFDEGDTLGGRGRVAVRFSQHARVTRTDADIAIAQLRYRRFDLGDARAFWHSHGRDVAGSVDFGGASGRLSASGVVVLPARAPLDAVVARSRFEGKAELQGLDLGVWLPALGYQLPVDGRIDATATVAGRLGDPAVTTVATLRDGSFGRFPVDRFSISATSTRDRTTIRSIELDLPSVSIAGTGQFGLSPRSPVSLALHATSDDLGALSTRFFGAAYPLTGSGAADLSVGGTRDRPRIAGRIDVASASVRGVSIPQAGTGFSIVGRNLVLSDAQARFAAGTLTLDGAIPLQVSPFALGPANARVALTLGANDLELANFAPLLPPGSLLRGRIDGTVTVGGTAGAPNLGGALTLAAGSLQTPFETVALTEGRALVRFDGDAIRLDSLHAAAGGGTVDASGSARFVDLVHAGSASSYDFVARADKLHLALPAYGSGTLEGTLALARLSGAAPHVEGDLRLSDGTIPFSALLLAGGNGPTSGGGFDATEAATNSTSASALGPKLPQSTTFDLDVSAEKNVRVRSANVDIGARGDLHVSGSRAEPILAGSFVSTGGTVSYFNTVFRLTSAKVTFSPDSGLVPSLDAVATTHVIDPDTNTLRNAAGTADVTLTLTGPVTNLAIALKSDPSYAREQILGLLLGAPALGASNLFGDNRAEATLYGSNASSGLSTGNPALRTQPGEVSVAQEAFGVANAQFTRTLLAPIETTFAQAVGLSNFNVNVDYTGNVGVSARKVLGKNVNAIYGTSFGYPYRQTFGFELKQSASTAAQVTVFQTFGENGLSSLTPTTFITSTSNPKYNAAQPSAGTVGFSLSLQHLF